MKQTKTLETTIVVELAAQDVIEYVTEKKLVPVEWQFYSVDIVGNGISKGAKLVIKHSETLPSLKGNG